MIKNECDIVKDLLPNYVENQINNNTKEFVEKHIKNCSKCNEMLKMLKGEQTEDEMKNKIENIEIDFLKKYNKKMKVLKYIAIILGLTVVVLYFIILGKTIYENIEENKAYQETYKTNEANYKTYEEVHAIVDVAYERTKDFYENNNYIYKEKYDLQNQEVSNTSYSTIYYKDGKFKEEYDLSSGLAIPSNREFYGLETKQILHGVKKEDMLCYINFLDKDRLVSRLSSVYCNGKEKNLKELIYPEDARAYSNYEVREEEGCYVIRNNISYSNDYSELWIEKERMMPIQKINYKETSYSKISYTYEIDTVKDEDVMLSKEQTDEIYKKVELSNQIKNGTYKVPENTGVYVIDEADLIKIKPILAY